jgi:hypothetical protein
VPSEYANEYFHVIVKAESNSPTAETLMTYHVRLVYVTEALHTGYLGKHISKVPFEVNFPSQSIFLLDFLLHRGDDNI